MVNQPICMGWSEEERRSRAVSLATSLCRYAAGDRERDFLCALAVDLKIVGGDVMESIEHGDAMMPPGRRS